MKAKNKTNQLNSIESISSLSRQAMVMMSHLEKEVKGHNAEVITNCGFGCDCLGWAKATWYPNASEDVVV